MTDLEQTMDRLVSLSVGTCGAEDYQNTFLDVSELAKGLAPTHTYISVSAQKLGDSDTEDREELRHDENTLNKVREAIVGSGFTVKTATELISAIQNAGILFRERA